MLSAFFEEKNIRWGELVGGLLIVGCSLALVISFWSSIAERPLLKFGLFYGVAALIFGLGLHAERRWRLPTTALGLLMIATLLTPLNFLAVASLGRDAAAEPAWAVLGEVAVIGLFAALLTLAGRSLVAKAPWALAVGVLVPSALMLLTRRVADPGVGLMPLLTLAVAPWLAQAAAVGGWMARGGREPEMTERSAHEALRLLGVSVFAAATGTGLLMARCGPIATMLHRLALLSPLAGAPALVVGLVLWRRITAPTLVAYRTTGTAVAAAGTLVLLSGIALAWPDPAGMMTAALLNAVVLTAVALLVEIPQAHILAGCSLALAYLLGWQVATGTLGWQETSPGRTARALTSGASGAALVPIVVIFAALAAVGVRLGRRADARSYALAAVLAAMVSLGLVTWHGFGAPTIRRARRGSTRPMRCSRWSRRGAWSGIRRSWAWGARRARGRWPGSARA